MQHTTDNQLASPHTLDPKIVTKKIGLRYISDEKPGIRRQRQGSGFTYFTHTNERITDPIVIEKIQNIRIPPAWENVWICPNEFGYLQATGFDIKGRKQYLYHNDWLALSQENKFNRLIFFGNVLPKLRRHIADDMKKHRLERERVIATVTWLLDHTFLRIGNTEYAKANKSYGLTTLRVKHVEVEGSEVKFEFRGKSGVNHSIGVHHPQVVRTIKRCLELPGYELFQYKNEANEILQVHSDDINGYLKNITGEDITAKDFRTWGGTVLAASTLYSIGDYDNKIQLKQHITETVKSVSKHLRNTTSVCRKYYIHPTIFNVYEGKKLIPHFESVKEEKKTRELHNQEFATLTLLEKYSIS